MKNRLVLTSLLFMICFAPVAQAGFLVKKTIVVAAHAATAHQAGNTAILHKEKSTGFITKLNKHLAFLHPYQFRKKNEWYGIAALGCGIIGLFVPGVNFLAILFGVLGMGRGCQVQGLAVAGFVMGILELALFLLIQAVFVSLILL